MRIEQETRDYTSHGTVVAAPVSLGFGDCMALLLSGVLLAVSILWPRRIGAGR